MVEPATRQNERPTRQTKEMPNEAKQKPMLDGARKKNAQRGKQLFEFIIETLPVSWDNKRNYLIVN